jgi:hypothetical protein
MFIEVERGTLNPVTPWEDPAWRDEAVAWTRTTAAGLGLAIADEGWRVRLRPWSVLFRVPVEGAKEPVWFKANPAASRFEAGLAWHLGHAHPEHTVTPLAADPARGWSLLPDGGPVLREVLAARASASVEDFIPVVRQYAEFQRAASAETAVELGVPRLTVTELPETLEQVLAAGRSLSETDRAELDKRLPDFTTWCAELADAGVPDSLDHADLHDGQIFAPGADGRYRFFDWGDSVVAHPFSSMLVTSRVIRRLYGADDADVTRLREAYLEAWSAEHDRAVLREMLELACRVGAVARILVWNRVFPGNGGLSAGWVGELTAAGDF